ncbi:hypothetical protein BGZ83_008900 [Gryganskiella cystojenkinii]|nr:hypothetical protein BGZ83_008900 [Gryganskiella cystojenkinii]
MGNFTSAFAEFDVNLTQFHELLSKAEKEHGFSDMASHQTSTYIEDMRKAETKLSFLTEGTKTDKGKDLPSIKEAILDHD